MERNYVYPFAAVIGQEKVKKALILNVINPSIGGVLISGEKGTAKSTLVRGLANLMKNMQVIDLPLNVTEDKLLGTIDIERAIVEGERSFEPGILKKAHGNILYVDEVNLLSEHIVNCLLEVSASGVNHVEREGISFKHPSNFVLVGTMNPEEGNLRSQFLDRFGLYLDVKGSVDLSERKEIIKRRLKYEENPVKYIDIWEEETEKLLNKILKAKSCLEKVKVSESVMNIAAQISNEANCSGHRAELVIVETAKAISAFDNRKNITIEDVKEAAELALPHRMRENPPEMNEPQENEEPNEPEEDNEDKEDNSQQDNNPNNGEQQQEANEENDNEDEDSEEDKQDNEDKEEENPENNLDDNEQEQDNEDDDNETVDDIGRIFTVKSLDIKPMDRKKHKGSGKRSKTKTDSKQGRYIRYTLPKEKLQDVAFDATLRAAAPYQRLRDKKGLAVVIDKSDFREKVREKRTGSTILFIVDASGSMGAKKRMSAVKGAVVSLLTDAYQKRDKVGMIAFRKKEAEVLLGITRSVDLAQKNLKTLPTGGKTPLAAGLSKGYELLKAAKKKDPDILPVIVLVSDGRANQSLGGGDAFDEAIEMANKIYEEGIQSIVIDSEQDFIKLGLAKEIAQAMDAKYYKLEELEAGEIAGAVRNYV
ncbi:magnesium chelatase subunit D family protein [Clostridium cochlearium]|uniref:magnesium chelatase subunit D family protein n=1 Tax=Clostridium cochlearium TaxID=1494 RepID=UPI00156E294D|nr:magnesium chelatase subunit D family protein [Clostridium cochlearium]MBV1818356.1 magnesium chelatase subunit D family protein [Bacteroidales bacterium MSK.15.36]MCG4580330.1 magnesium chelatase subunit D family protein [Clostridium cochlearium]NSJ90791.1 magnesium chelatase subunit D family protein [Coprococcus sp. MSK.21.13]